MEREGILHVVTEYYYRNPGEFSICLLYTSDAADEEDSVDLGGRRIIYKKKRYWATTIINKCERNSRVALVSRV